MNCFRNYNRSGVVLLQRQEELAALAERTSRFERAGIHVLVVGDGAAATARGLVLALEDETIHLVDLWATRGLGPLDAVLPKLTLVGHALKRQLIALGSCLSTEAVQLFDTQIAARLLDGSRNPGAKSHGLVDVLARHLGVNLPRLLNLPSTGFLSSLHREAADLRAMWLLRLADQLSSELKHHRLEHVAALEFSVLPAVVEMEVVGMAVDFDRWTALTKHRDTVVQRLSQRLCANLGLQDLRRNELTRDALSRALGVSLARTDAVSLAPFSAHPIVQDLVLFRKYNAFLQQLGWPLVEQLADAPDRRVRCTFDQLGASTGRFTTTTPNLLGVSKDDEVRSCFVAAPGHALVDADYSNIDLRVLAEIADARRLIGIFNTGGDVHRQTAGRMLGKSPISVSDDERQGAKPANFGVCYGMGPGGLVKSALKNYNLALTGDQAEAWIAAFFAAYPGVWAWQRKVERQALREIRTLAGRRRFFDDPHPKLTEQLATLVQGSTADGFKQAIARLYLPLKRLGARIILTPHDELLVEAPEDVLEAAEATVATEMKLGMATYIGAVPIVVDVQTGPTWSA